MAKRMTDTDKWKKPFVRGLQGAYKLLWIYLLDECNHAGIWHVEWDIVKLRLGADVDVDIGTALKVFNNHVIVIDNGSKWFIKDFVEFQYGVLEPSNKVHNSVLTMLNKYKIKGLARGLQSSKDKDKDKTIDKDKDKRINFEMIWEVYPKKMGKEKAFKFFKSQVKTEEDLENIKKAVLNFDLSTTGQDMQFVKHGSTWFNNDWKDWINPLESKPEEEERDPKFRLGRFTQ